MLYSLRGTVVHYDTQSIAVECGGVAYYCLTTLTTLSQVASPDNEVLLYTHMNVRQDAVDLFAFADRAELNCFRMLTSVSGVGPKAALAILSVLTPERLALSIASGDTASIMQAQGVGKKLAQRIALELKDKVGGAELTGSFGGDIAPNIRLDAGNVTEAISALVVLGYSQSDAAAVVSKLDESMPVEDMIKAGLKALAGKL